jgi:LysR family glycine cleavage system transcriptional activator
MLRILPHTALRTLESVVRLRGFGHAADELNVTQSAVSQHIKAIEEWTGHRMLNRSSRGTSPTENGSRLAAAVREGYGIVEASCNELRDKRTPQSQGITVSTAPGFAFIWMFPRLLGFDQKCPGVPLSISANTQTSSFTEGKVDVIIHYGLNDFPGLHVEHFLSEVMTPVCAPELLEKGSGLKNISDLSEYTLLVDEISHIGNPPTWEHWAKAAQVVLPKMQHIRKFSQSNMVIQAAIKGLGVAMGRSPLIADALREGTLVRPFPQAVKSQYSYWFVCPHEAMKSKNIREFRDWLHEEVATEKLPLGL